MKEKRKDCLYCGKEMLEVKTIRRKFCSDLCRVNFSREVKYEKEIRKVLDNPIFNKLKRDTLFNLIVYGSSEMPNKQEIKSALNYTETKKEDKEDSSFEKHKLWKQGDPKENTNAFFMRYDCWNYAELENLKSNKQ